MARTYPTSDGKPFSESDWHFGLMSGLISKLQHRYRVDSQAYVSGNLLVYYEEGNARKRVAPDVFVAFGAEKKLRQYYLTWQERKNISVVIECTSAKTRRHDSTTKFQVYRDVLKVAELFYFDLFAEYLNPRLQGYRLDGIDYSPIAPENGRLFSGVLSAWLEPCGLDLLVLDSVVISEPDQRAAKIEKDFLELSHAFNDVQRKYERTLWQKDR